MIADYIEAGATFSPCRKYRYELHRIWDARGPFVMFIGLNPSTANEHQDDPTIRKVIKFAKDWGFGGVYMLNLFAYVTPYPEELQNMNIDTLGENDEWLLKISYRVRQVIFAWGSFEVMGRDKIIIDRFPFAHCLMKNKNGTPRHPLYVPGKTSPIDFGNV